jgi:hypothetical protein
MKRLILSLAIVLVMVLSLAAPAIAAGGSQTWYLYNATMTDKWSNIELYMSTTQGQTGHVDVASTATKMWIANKIAAAKVTYPNDVWVARIATDSDWGAGGSLCVPEIGYWNGTTFTGLAGAPDVKYYASNFVVELKFVPIGGESISANTYLAVWLTNLDNGTHKVYTGEELTIGGVKSWYYSCLATPESDPGYPLPELAAGILLGAGLLGVGGFMMIRRKQSAFKA